MKNQQPSDLDEITDGKVWAILSYLSIFCIIPLVLKKDNSFVLHHGKQGLVLFVAEVAAFILHIALGAWLLRLSVFILGVLSFIGIINVLQGRYFRIPVIADYAEKINL